MTSPVIFWWGLTYMATLGAVIGSFLNVVIARVPAGESIVRPRSRCPRCKALIAWYDNVPIVSWLVLRARCRSCRAPIAARYPLIELLMGCLGAALWVRFGLSLDLVMWFPLTAALLAIAFIDVDHWIVPDVISFPSMAWAAAAAALPGGLTVPEAAAGLIPALGLWAIGWLASKALRREAMGMGDIKLLAVMGLALGPLEAVFALFVASVFGSVVGVALMFTGGHQGVRERAAASGESQASVAEATVETTSSADDEDDWVPPPRAVPFGPFLVLGTLAVVFFPELVYFALGRLTFGLAELLS